MKNPRFDKNLFIRHEDNQDGTTSILAFQDPADAVDGDGPMFVATYQLVSVRKVISVTELGRTTKRLALDIAQGLNTGK